MFREHPPHRPAHRNPFNRKEYGSIWQLPMTWMLVVALGTIASILLVHGLKIEGGFEVTKTFLLVQGGFAATIVMFYVVSDGISSTFRFDRRTPGSTRQFNQFTSERRELDETRDVVNDQVHTFLSRVQGEMTTSRKASLETTRPSTTLPPSNRSPSESVLSESRATSPAVHTPVAPTNRSQTATAQNSETRLRSESGESSKEAIDFPRNEPESFRVAAPATARVRDIQTPSGTVISMPTKPRLQVVDGFAGELADASRSHDPRNRSEDSEDETESDGTTNQRRSPRALRVHRAA